MEVLGVIGNISRDQAIYAGGRHVKLLGGAALHVALAATRAGLPSAPVAVIGSDLGWIRDDVPADRHRPQLCRGDVRQVLLVPAYL